MPHRRGAHRARIRDRDRLRLHDLRPHPDVGTGLGGDDRALARRIRVGLARAHAGRRYPEACRARRGGRKPRAPQELPRGCPGRPDLRVRRRRRARGRAGLQAPRLALRAPARPRPGAARRGDPHRGRLRRAHGARGGRAGAPAGDQGATCTRHDGAPRPARRVRAGAGRAALRAAPAGSDGLGLGAEARFRSDRQCPRAHRRIASLAAHRGSRSRSTRAGRCSSSIAGSGSGSASSEC